MTVLLHCNRSVATNFDSIDRVSFYHVHRLFINVVITFAGAEATYFASFGEGSGPIVLGNLGCQGTERRLADCTSGVTDSCTHREDAGVRCTGKFTL